MRSLFFTVVLIASAFCASAQKVYFIYLQSDNYDPFYVKMNDKIFSSEASGYLILSNLVDSTYNFSIGFSSSQAESRFAVTLGGKDRGFLIKNFASGLGLFDWQDLTIINAQKDESAKNISYQKRNDSFSALLSKAANDTSLLYSVVRAKEDVAVNNKQLAEEVKLQMKDTGLTQDTSTAKSLQTDVASETEKKDTALIVETKPEINKQDDVGNASLKQDSVKNVIALTEQKELPKQIANDTSANTNLDSSAKKEDASLQEEATVFKRSQIKKHSESSTSEGFGLVFYDKYEGEQDTIRLIIPNPPVILKQPTEGDSSEQQDGFIHVEELKKDTVEQTPVIVAEKNAAPVKAQCKSVASDKDFFKLRKNMAAEETDEAMVEDAKKAFKSKCFTTEQIKNLSSLFLTSAGKYLFFDAAYLHVSNQEKFSSLASEIKDDYYLKRFKAMIGE